MGAGGKNGFVYTQHVDNGSTKKEMSVDEGIVTEGMHVLYKGEIALLSSILFRFLSTASFGMRLVVAKKKNYGSQWWGKVIVPLWEGNLLHNTKHNGKREESTDHKHQQQKCTTLTRVCLACEIFKRKLSERK